ncbi:cytochrome c-type biogenesis protein [Dichotomicrobium thermohalophilum]|uniref:cytochrome c-type biogenesis protein n=1 Tax=Dichotomicrobium thermohalophilum TaxID=933063 RepID=UPI001FE1E158|nr:cytochrome c-type biogenesis protein [Dichotomicrobium thermohalophilum]
MLAITLALVLMLPAAAQAVEPDEVLDNPKLEQRAREISKGLRCVVCQNESIDESNADLAKDLRILVRQRLKAGDTNEEVVDYVVARYGEFVLLEPRFAPHTYLLWLAPALLLLFGIMLAYKLFRGRAARVEASAPKPLSEAERQRLNNLLAEGSDDSTGAR